MIAFDEHRTKRRQLLGRVSVGAVLALLVVGETGWMHTNRLVEQSMFVLGMLLTGIGMVGRVWSLTYAVGRKNIQLITDGPYSLCRNPLYLSSFLAALGVAFCTATLTVPFILVAVFYAMHRNTILQEESQLRRLFGAEFEAYCRTTPRFWPSFRNFSEESSHHIMPQFFRRGIFSLIYFIVVICVTVLLQTLHESGLLPTLIWIY